MAAGGDERGLGGLIALGHAWTASLTIPTAGKRRSSKSMRTEEEQPVGLGAAKALRPPVAAEPAVAEAPSCCHTRFPGSR